MDAKDDRTVFPRALCAALTLLVMALTLACVGAKGEEGTVTGKTDNADMGLKDPTARHPIGSGDWEFDKNGNIKVNLKGYKKGDVLWLHQDGMDISFYESDTYTSFTFFEEGATTQLATENSDHEDPKTAKPEFKDPKETFEKTLEKAKKALKKLKKKEKKQKENDGKSSYEGSSVPITLDLGIFVNRGDDCHRREPCRREEPRHETRGLGGFRF
ncbi:MAG: hypothetical protein HY291_01380 [Planctomycetes bacterium]|nr:hypothetical protein [Planctomycetota bacterium]